MKHTFGFFGWVIAATLAWIAWSSPARAAVPGTLTQQGRLLDSGGMPVSGPVAFVFTIYDAPTAGASLWTESQMITLEDGYFSARLGDMTAIPATVFTGAIRYLGIKVATDSEAVPREPLTSVPYAILAGQASHAAAADTATMATSATNATTAATATNVAFTGLTGIPAPCAAGQFLKGYDNAGAAQCATLPALSCVSRGGDETAVGGCNWQACMGGEVLTGGGCNASGPINRSFPYRCPLLACLCIAGACCPANPSWECTTTDGSAPTAYAVCCKVQ
jgi:hypothetical protein